MTATNLTIDKALRELHEGAPAADQPARLVRPYLRQLEQAGLAAYQGGMWWLTQRGIARMTAAVERAEEGAR